MFLFLGQPSEGYPKVPIPDSHWPATPTTGTAGCYARHAKPWRQRRAINTRCCRRARPVATGHSGCGTGTAAITSVPARADTLPAVLRVAPRGGARHAPGEPGGSRGCGQIVSAVVFRPVVSARPWSPARPRLTPPWVAGTVHLPSHDSCVHFRARGPHGPTGGTDGPTTRARRATARTLMRATPPSLQSSLPLERVR